MQSASHSPTYLTTAGWLLCFDAAVWLALGAATLLRGSRSGMESPAARWVIAILMAGNAAMMLLAGWGLGTGRRLFYLLALPVLAVNILLTFTDEFGLLDFHTLLIDLAILGLLFAGWKGVRRLFST